MAPSLDDSPTNSPGAKMDLVLEVFDTIFFDKVYATVFPRSSSWPAGLVKSLGLQTSSGTNILDSLDSAASGINSNYTTLLSSASSFSQAFSAATQHVYGEQPFLLPPSHYAALSAFARTNWIRQLVSLTVITSVFGLLLYFMTAGLSYWLVYDKENMKHPKFLKNQLSMEMKQASSAIPVMSLMTAACFVLEIRGYSKLYWKLDDHPSWYLWVQFPLFIMFTDCLIYLIHRGLHHPLVYKTLHKPHHKWIVSTPFASHAFHPLDGFMQSIPYHVFPFVFPLQKGSYIVLFVLINVWTVMIHDGDYLARDPVINGAACHTVHHLYFNYNYGQYTTLWDRIGGSYRVPDSELFDKSLKNDKKTWKEQSRKMEKIVKEVENGDDRVYSTPLKKDL